jgi:hypothetical protein
MLRCFLLLPLLAPLVAPARAAGGVTREGVERALRRGVDYLKQQQRVDGSWADADGQALTGTTSLATLALLTAGEKVDSPHVAAALGFLRNVGPGQLQSTYAVALLNMVFAAAEPDRDRLRILANAQWLQQAQIRPGDRVNPPGSWSYSILKTQRGDPSNTQYALLGLQAASEAGVDVSPQVWSLARLYWEGIQRRDGGWSYGLGARSPASASMTCAGISSLIITGVRRFEDQESFFGGQIQGCGSGGVNINLQRGIDWLAAHFAVNENIGHGQTFRYYYLYGLERAGRLTGQRFFGAHDWYREGAQELVADQDRIMGYWRGAGTVEGTHPVVPTSFAVLFLAKGRAPVLINKLRFGSSGDWNHDQDDIRNLVGLVSRDWKNLLTWQVVDPGAAGVEDLLQAPIAFVNGHGIPEFTEAGKKVLHDYVEQGGLLFAEACCGSREFDRGFRALMKELFPGPEQKLHALDEGHAVWRTRFRLTPDLHPLLGIEYGCRTVVIYSPGDLSCYWNQMENDPHNPAVILAQRVGQNVVDYATGRALPDDKLTVREARVFAQESPKRGALRIAKLVHGVDWNIARLAVPNLMETLRRPPLSFDVVLTQKDLAPSDPNLVNYPLVYLHGRSGFHLAPEDLGPLRRHLEPGGGTLFADAACGSPAFDASFRRFVAELLPKNPLVPIPRDDELYTTKVGFDLSSVQYSKAAGGRRDFPQLEGVKLDGHWAIIYSKYDLGCALERHQGPDCMGYTSESATQIAANIVIYSTLP